MLEAVLRSLDLPQRILRVPLGALMLVASVLEGVLRPLGVQPPLHRRRMDFFRKSFRFSVEDARRLGYEPRTGLEEGMRATAQWYLERGLLEPRH
jgi:nucleoside-diphosphate-sugar epimerase